MESTYSVSLAEIIKVCQLEKIFLPKDEKEILNRYVKTSPLDGLKAVCTKHGEDKLARILWVMGFDNKLLRLPLTTLTNTTALWKCSYNFTL